MVSASRLPSTLPEGTLRTGAKGSPVGRFQELVGEGRGKPDESGMKGMFKKKQQRTRPDEHPAPKGELAEAAPEPKSDARVDAEAVARAVLDALNAHDPL